MLRCSVTRLRVSAFSIFLHDLAKLGKLKGKGNPQQFASALYKKLDASAMRSLKRRAERSSYPALDAYNQFQRTYAPRLKHLSNKKRQRTVAQLWSAFKKNGKLDAKLLTKATEGHKASARSVVKNASKQSAQASSLA